MVSHVCSKEKEIDKLDKAVFNSGHGLIQNVSTILEKVDNLEEQMDAIKKTTGDTSISMHLIEIAVAKIEQKLSDQSERKQMSWQKASIIASSILALGGIAASIIFKV